MRGDGSSILVIEGDTSLTNVLGEVSDFSGFAGLEIGDGATITVTSTDEVNLLAKIGVVSGSGTLTINGTETLNLAEVTVVTGLTINGTHTNLSDVSTIDGTFSLEQGSMTNINTDGVNLAGASTTTTGFSIENGQLLITDTSLTGRQLVVIGEFDHDANLGTAGISVTYAIVLPDLDIAPTQANFDGITFDELDEGVNLNLSDALSTALPNLDPVFVLTKATANNGTVNGFSYNSGEFSDIDTITFTLTNVVTGEEFDFTVDLAITAVNDEGIIQITGNRQEGETLTAELIDLDGGVEVLSYAWSQGAVTESESSFDITSSTDELELTITYRDALNLNVEQTATITIAAENILAEGVDTQITLNLEDDSTTGVVILEDSNNSDSFIGLTLGNPVNIATTLAYTTATISLVDDGSGGEQINFEYVIDTTNSEYIALDEGEELLDSITLTTTEGVSLVREFTVVGENDIASFSSGNALTVNDSSGLNQGTTETQSYVIVDADGTEQEDLVQNFGLIATSGTLDSEVIASTDLAAYGTLNVNPPTNELSFLKGEGVDALLENEVVVLSFSVESIDQTTLPVTVTINGTNDIPVIVNEELTIAEDSGQVVIPVLDNDSDAEGDALTVTEVTGENNGTVNINGQNQLEYTANANFFGTETLSYTVSDGTTTQSATVMISVTPVEDQGRLVVTGFPGRGSSLSVILVDQDGINGSDVTFSLVDGDGNLIEGSSPVLLVGVGNGAASTLVVPSSVSVGSEIIVRASYIDAGGVSYGTTATFISADSLTIENIAPTIGGIIPTDIMPDEGIQDEINLSSLEFSDVDGDNLTVTLTASTGILTIFSFVGDTDDIIVSGLETSELTLIGSISDIHNYLDPAFRIQYTGELDVFGENAATITIIANDGITDSTPNTINIDIAEVDNPPSIGGTIPTDITVSEDTLSNIDLSSLEFFDNDSERINLTLTVNSGILRAESQEVSVSGNGTNQLITSGTVSSINDYLDIISSVQYVGPSNVNGEDAATLRVAIDNSITLEDSEIMINLDITAVNNAPTIGGTIPTEIIVNSDGSYSNIDLSSLEFTDVDGEHLAVTLAGSSRTFRAAFDDRVGVIGNQTRELTLTGSVSDIHSYLDVVSNIEHRGNNTSNLTIRVGSSDLFSTLTINLINGQTQTNTLTDGVDTFVYTDTDIGSENIDTITDFALGEDKIDLSGVSALASSPIFATVSSTIGEGVILTDDILAYTNAGTTNLYIDANNDGTFNAANDIQIEFSNGVNLVTGDFIF